MKKKGLLVAALCLGLLLTGCSSSGGEDKASETVDTNPDKQLEIIGNAVKYDPNQPVNDGKPITIDFWSGTEGEPALKMIDKYVSIHPNVTIKPDVKAWSDYWTKLPLALKGKNGPALFSTSNAYDDVISPYAALYDISVEDLAKDYKLVELFERNGGVQYINYSTMTGSIFYNKKLWNEAGLTDDDIPATWDEFIEVGKKLTKFKGDKLVQAAFNYNDSGYQEMITALNYQKGQLMFTEDGKKMNFNTEVTKENTQFMVDLYEKHKLGDKNFGDEYLPSFGNGQSAMIYGWGWIQNELKTTYPDIDFGVFPTPTFTKDTPFAYDRYDGEATPGVNKNQTKEQQAVAQDFIRFILAGDEYSKLGALQYATFPTKYSLRDDKDIQADPVLNTIAPRVDRLIWPGPFPSTLETVMRQTGENILYNGMSVDKAMEEAQQQMDKDMTKTSFVSLENKYEFYNEATGSK